VRILFLRAYVADPSSHSIQPPGAWHMVYTADNSLVTGGHFLSYKTMSATMLNRLHYKFSVHITNSDHPYVELSIVSMASSLRVQLHGESERLIIL
jgi:hypothetical protein